MLAPLKPGGRRQSTFLQLRPGVFGWMPFGHTSSIPARIYIVINKAAGWNLELRQPTVLLASRRRNEIKQSLQRYGDWRTMLPDRR